MASQILNGATNASYTNNTGQNVRLIINYMANVTSMTWSSSSGGTVNVTAESTTIGKDIQNITGEFRKLKLGRFLGDAVNSINPELIDKIYELDTELITGLGRWGDRSADVPGSTAPIYIKGLNNADKNARTSNGRIRPIVVREMPFFTTFGSTQDFQSALYYVPKTVSRGGNFPVEIMLANGHSFSAVCGAYNAVAIKEDGT